MQTSFLWTLISCTSPPPTEAFVEEKTSWIAEDFTLFFSNQADNPSHLEGALVVTIDDEMEYVSGNSVMDIDNLKMQITEDVILDSNGLVLSWEQSIQYDLGQVRTQYHHSLDATSKTITSRVQNTSYTTTWEEEHPVIMESLNSDLFYGFDIPSLALGHVRARLAQNGSEYILINPSWRTVSLHTATPPAPCFSMESANYCYDLDGRLASYESRVSFLESPLAIRSDTDISIADLSISV